MVQEQIQGSKYKLSETSLIDMKNKKGALQTGLLKYG